MCGSGGDGQTEQKTTITDEESTYAIKLTSSCNSGSAEKWLYCEWMDGCTTREYMVLGAPQLNDGLPRVGSEREAQRKNFLGWPRTHSPGRARKSVFRRCAVI